MFHVGLVPYDVARRVGVEGPEFKVGQTRFLFAFLSLSLVLLLLLFCFFFPLVFFLVIAVLVCFFIWLKMFRLTNFLLYCLILPHTVLRFTYF